MPRVLEEEERVIPGASSGIGQVAARWFAEKGARSSVGAHRRIDGRNDLCETSAKACERRNRKREGMRQQRRETPNGSALPRSPFGAVASLTALVLVARSLCRANSAKG
jgi:NAD(P)-dependent dehydrogenase (short-subunit alcohol dehydrogenase family)